MTVQHDDDDVSEDDPALEQAIADVIDGKLGAPKAVGAVGDDLRERWESEFGLSDLWGRIPSEWSPVLISYDSEGRPIDWRGGLRAALLDAVKAGRVDVRVKAGGAHRSLTSAEASALRVASPLTRIPAQYVFNCYEVAQLPSFGWLPHHQIRLAQEEVLGIAETLRATTERASAAETAAEAASREAHLARLEAEREAERASAAHAREARRAARPFVNLEQYIRDNYENARKEYGKNVELVAGISGLLVKWAKDDHDRALKLESVKRRVRDILNTP